MRDYRKLEVWQAGRALAVDCYRATVSFPAEEKSGLVAQIRRAAVSVPANVAEGAGRDSEGDFLRFLRISLGSLNEVETLFAIASDLDMVAAPTALKIEEATRDIGVRLRNLARKVEADLGGPPSKLVGNAKQR